MVPIKFQKDFFEMYNSKSSSVGINGQKLRGILGKKVLPHYIVKYVLNFKHIKFYNSEAKIHINQWNRKT